MAECIRITEKTAEYFLPLLPDEERAGYLSEKNIFAIGAIDNGVACGVMTCYAKDYDIFIQYIYVADEYRRMGIGTEMVDFLCKYAYPYDISVSLAFSSSNVADEPIFMMLDGMGNFDCDELEGYRCYIDPEEMESINKYITNEKQTNIVPISSLKTVVRNSFMKQMQAKSGILFNQNSSLLIDDLCMCYYNEEEDAVKGVVFCGFDSADKRNLRLNYLWCSTDASIVALKLLIQLKKEMDRLELSDKRLFIDAINRESKKLIDQLMPGREVIEHFYRSVWNMKL